MTKPRYIAMSMTIKVKPDRRKDQQSLKAMYCIRPVSDGYVIILELILVRLTEKFKNKCSFTIIGTKHNQYSILARISYVLFYQT